MKLLEIKPTIYKFDNFEEFVKEFNIGLRDAIFTNKSLYEAFMKDSNVGADFIFREKYLKGEPSNEAIDNILSDTRDKNYKRIIAIGGGSIIDIAKILVLKNEGNTSDLFEKKVPIIKERELIVIPTTCGTGSEVTNISIAEIKDKQTKMGLAVNELYPDYAVLIPEFVKSVPYKFFVYSSIDALIHAMESLVSPKSNCYTELFSKKAIEIILNGYKKIMKQGEEYRLAIIEDMLVASNYAGIAFSNTGVGAVHALSYPLGGKYHVPHGEANYQLLIEVFKLYKDKNPNGKIKEVDKLLSEILDVKENDVYIKLEELLENMIHKNKLREYGMKEEEIHTFANSVINTQQRLLSNNYVELTETEMIDVYKTLY